jgi:hypothetical protein
VTPEAGQREYLRVAYDGEEPSPGPIWGGVERVPPSCRTVVGAVAGARSGKTFLGSLRILHLALTVPVRLGAGEEASVPIVAPDMRLARQAFRFVRGGIERLPSVRKMVVGKINAESVLLRRKDGVPVRIECLPASAGGSAVRGRNFLGALLEEACFFRDEATGVVNDAEIFRAIEPRIVRGGQLVVQSTPWGPTGLLYDLHKLNYGRPQTALIAHAATRLMRSDAWLLEQIARSELADAENAAREFGALFSASAGNTWFDGASLDPSGEECGAIVSLEPMPGEELTAGADLAFTRNGAVLVVVGRLGDRRRVVYLEEVRPTEAAPLVPSKVLGHFASVLTRYRGCPVAADGHYRESFREALTESGLPLRPCPEGAQGKALVHTHARVLLREGKVSLPNHPRLLRQLRERTSKLTSGGALSFHAPTWTDGAHGDIADALLLALFQAHGASVPGPRVVRDPFDEEEEANAGRRDVLGTLTGARRR